MRFGRAAVAGKKILASSHTIGPNGMNSCALTHVNRGMGGRIYSTPPQSFTLAEKSLRGAVRRRRAAARPQAKRGRAWAGPPVACPLVIGGCHIIKDGCIWAMERPNDGVLKNSRIGVDLAVGREGSMY
jgi:hypothetical protein